ncbi:MAG: TPM domain-containing protein [Clostridia bacterium]|nr:TPM domain-containing protein [Clostridia bacterium]
MTRKIVSLCLALMLCISLAVSVSAASGITYIVDETGSYLTDSELENLNEYAAMVSDSCGTGIFFVYTTTPVLGEYDVETLTGGMKDYYVMVENDTSWYTFAGGSGTGIDPLQEDELRAVYDADATYEGGIGAFLEAAAECMPYIEDTPEGDILDVNEYFVYDDADILTDAEEVEVTQKLMRISHTYDAQIVIATIASMDDGDVDGFLEYFYDSMGLGYGEERNGVLLLVCMDPREYRILSNGYAGVAIDPDDIAAIGDEIVQYLSDGDYAEAFDEFADECAYYLDGYLNGFPFNFGKTFVICLVIGAIAGIITALVLKGQLKTVRQQNQANVYVKPGSMQVTVHRDLFLYREVSRVKKESNNSSKSGSSRSTGGGSF